MEFDSAVDASMSGSLIAAVSWIESVLTGTIATMIAILAVATVGAMLLSGRVDFRRGAIVLVGCFVLFSAKGIVAGIQSTVSGRETPFAAIPATGPPAFQPPASPGTLGDPYAGASFNADPRGLAIDH